MGLCCMRITGAESFLEIAILLTTLLLILIAFLRAPGSLQIDGGFIYLTLSGSHNVSLMLSNEYRFQGRVLCNYTLFSL